jgi:hypothetical protein
VLDGPSSSINLFASDGMRISGTGEDFLRRLSPSSGANWESRGYLLCCNAARVDAYPSAMRRSMGGGLLVDRLRMGKQGRRRDLLDGLAPAPVEKVGIVADQRAYSDRWADSLVVCR